MNALPAIGSRVGFVSGPCECPSDCAGTVVGIETDSWGSRAVVLMDDCSFSYVHDVHGLTTVGIGCYQLNAVSTHIDPHRVI